jgi:fatty-acyl-CoA synthase
VKVAAVVGVHHPKWEERPILIVEPHEGADLTEVIVADWLRERTVKWWLPNLIVFEAVPLTATGKIDKKAIRARHARALLPV